MFFIIFIIIIILFVCKLVWIFWMLASIYHKNLPYFISKTHKAHTPTQRNNGIGVVIKTHSQNLFNFHIPNKVMSWNFSFSSTHHSYWFYQQDSILHLHIYNSISCSFIIVCLTHFLVVLFVFMNYSHSEQYIPVMMVLTRRGRLRHFSGFGFLLWEIDRAEGEGELRKREILMEMKMVRG